jgi:hypothetical protein
MFAKSPGWPWIQTHERCELIFDIKIGMEIAIQSQQPMGSSFSARVHQIW